MDFRTFRMWCFELLEVHSTWIGGCVVDVGRWLDRNAYAVGDVAVFLELVVLGTVATLGIVTLLLFILLP